MRYLVVTILLGLALLGVSSAFAATYDLTWEQPAGLVADNARVERAPATGNTCGIFTEIAQLPVTTLTYQDMTAPPGLVCYRVRNARTITTPDGPLAEFSGYSNVAAAPRAAPPKNLRTP